MRQRIFQAWQMLQRGNVTAAEEVIQPLLVGSSISEEIAPLLGAIRLEQQRYSDAAPLLARARASIPREAHIAKLYGLALAGLGQLAEASAAFQDAIGLDPGPSAPYLALGLAQYKLGQWDDALSTIRKLLRQEPENVDALMALSTIMMENGDLAEAETPLRRAIRHAGSHRIKAEILSNLATVLVELDRRQEALECLDAAQALVPNTPNVDNRRIEILYQMGRFEDCKALFEKLLEKNPGDPLVHLGYNSLLYRLRDTTKYLKSYDRAPKTRDLMLAKAHTLSQEKRCAEAHDIYSDLLALDAADTTALTGSAISLLRMGRPHEALAALETAITLTEPDTAMFCGAAEAALTSGDPEKAEYFCQTALRDAPFDQTCLALLGTAWRLLGDARDEELNGYDSLIQVFDLKPPDGFTSMDNFNTELAAFLATAHPDTREYLERSLRGGTQTEGFLFNSRNMLIRKLKARIDESVEGYITALKAKEGHPFIARRRDAFSYLGAWSSRMRRCGFHANHIHPAGWLSSCYYVVVPEVTKDPVMRQGWIKFGEPMLDIKLKDPVRLAIQPVPGRLVLFPSYVWHGTIPFQDRGERTTIAFDAVPS